MTSWSNTVKQFRDIKEGWEAVRKTMKGYTPGTYSRIVKKLKEMDTPDSNKALETLERRHKEYNNSIPLKRALMKKALTSGEVSYNLEEEDDEDLWDMSIPDNKERS